MGIGEVFAALCPIAWSSATILFHRTGEHVHPIALNFFKTGLTLLLFSLSAYFINGNIIVETSTSDLLILLISGLEGIAIADGFFFLALNLVGASRMAIISCLYSPSVIFLSLFYYGDSLSNMQIVGAACVVLATVVASKKDKYSKVSRKNLITGIGVGAIAVVGSGHSILYIKEQLDSLPLLWILQVRIGAGFIGSSIMLFFHKNRNELVQSILRCKRPTSLFMGCILGGYLAMMLWLAGFKYTDASIAAVLNQLSTIFTIMLATIFLKERLTKRTIFAASLAFIGTMIITVYK